MESLAELHPIVVHFVIALGMVGIGLRVLSLVPKLPEWISPAATLLLLSAAGAGALAAKSGEDAHGPPERIPGVRAIVKEHEETGERARNALILVAIIEIAAIALRRRNQATLAKGAFALSAVAGLGAGYMLFEAGEHGGELVYEYAGGIGTKTGTADPEAVQNLLVAGLYQQAMLARKDGRGEEAARLIDEMVKQRGGEPIMQAFAAESKFKDLKDAPAALAAVQALPTEGDDAFLIKRGILESEILAALERKDEAKAVLTALQGRFPESGSVRRAVEALK